MTHNYFKNLHLKFDFVNFCDLNNYVTPVLNPLYIGWLNKHEDVKILAAVHSIGNDFDGVEVKDSFVDSSLKFGDIIMKASIFSELANK
jgi:hypothetical protein